MDKYKLFAERISQLNIKHPRVRRISNVLDSIRVNRRMCNGKSSPRHSFIIGGSGVGKTITARGYANENPGYVQVDEEGNEIDIKPVLYIELPNPFTIQELYQTIIAALDAPQMPGKPTTGDLKRQAFKLLKVQKVEILIMDEMDYILTSRSVKRDEAMECIKHIGNQNNISLVCVGTPEAGELRKLKDQYFRRLIPIYLKRFNICDDEFCQFLKSVEEQIDPPFPIGLGEMDTQIPQMLHFMSKGVVGILTPTIQEAYRLLGVFEDDFQDFTQAKLTVSVLLEAYKNIIGDLRQVEFDAILKAQDEKTNKEELVM